MKKIPPSLILAVLAASALTSCGRNPGANARAYPGSEKIEAALAASQKIEAALAASQPKCVAFDLKRIRASAHITGKEKFTTERKGLFKLDSFQISQVTDRADRTVSSSVLQISDFDDIGSRAPRLAIEPKCLDLKGTDATLAISPVSEIDSATGLILRQQPFTLAFDTKGGLSAESKSPVAATQIFPAGKVPEVALLLGAEYVESFKTVSFRVEESEDGSLYVKAEFLGMDANLSRLFVHVEAVYGWNSAE